MSSIPSWSLAVLLLSLCLFNGLQAAADPASSGSAPKFWNYAPTPPMGWNSYDAFGDSVTESEFMQNVRYVHKKLQSHGYDYVVVDYRWFDGGAYSGPTPDRIGAFLNADQYGRLEPAPNRFPSAIHGLGFKPLADRVHAMGLKFGIHVQRGIPREDLKANTPIEGSTFKAADAADVQDKCGWSADMYGVRGATPAGQAWYDSILRQYAAWGVDFIKVDDLSAPYHADEVAAIRRAIDKCGRPIVFSTSPGETPLANGADVEVNANMWRTASDMWDRWPAVMRAFTLATIWTPYRGYGHWPDLDMIPIGHIAIRCYDGGSSHDSHFTPDERKTLMTLWSIAKSPLILGPNLPDTDTATLALFTNDEVLAVDQHSENNRQLFARGDQVAWVADVPHSADKYVALFRNEADIAPKAGDTTAAQPADVAVSFKDLGLTGPCRVRDLWNHRNLGSFPSELKVPIAFHGAGLFRVSPAR